MKEEELYLGLLEHDERAYQQVMQDYTKLLWAIAASVLNDKNRFSAMDIEEVVSDVFIRLWQYPEKFNPSKGSLKSYLTVMAKSLAINKYRQNQKKNVLQLIDNQEAKEQAIALAEEDWSELYSAIQLLEEPFKEIIIRRFFYEEKPKEIRQRMKLSSKEVDNFLYRGKQKLKRILGDREYLKEV
ncbi:sigma-70 family RNA polymerase sigma factor [Enterococcus sp. HY326]|uniref:sigma-70 family RNA polymerase sigma factor n=1 Tax=Enterococcus sp. HY326 TaxID=2971265 RepID=UPI00223F9C6D|nr:sigma-70 family RNA polymerase sigma factor [Enterococcus sp. HY326]